MKSICVKLKDEKFHDYLFVLYINPMNVLADFIIYKHLEKEQTYRIVPHTEFNAEDLQEINTSFYQVNTYTVLNEMNPLVILLKKIEEELIAYKLSQFENSNIFKDKKRQYELLFAGEVLHDLYFLVSDTFAQEYVLLKTDTYNEKLKFVKDLKVEKQVHIEKLAAILGLIVHRIKEKTINFIIHLDEHTEIMIYKDGIKGYAFIITNTGKHTTTGEEDYSIRYLFYDLSIPKKANILYQNELNQHIISDLRVEARIILAKSKYSFLFEGEYLNNSIFNPTI